MTKSIRTAMTIAALLAVASASAQSHDGDILVARNAGGALQIGGSAGNPGFDTDHSFAFLVFQNGAFGPGWFSSNPGFDAYRDSNPPSADFLPMLGGANVHLRAVALDPAVKVVRVEPGQGVFVIEQPGDRIRLGDHDLHKHCTWMIDQDDPGYVDRPVFYGTFVLDDDSGLHAPSLPFTMHLTYYPPCPGDINADGQTGQADLAALLASYNLCAGDAGYAPYANLDPTPNGEGLQCINQGDLALLLANYGCAN